MFDWIFFIVAGKEDNHKSFDGLNFGQISPLTTELPVLEHLKLMFNVVSNFELSFLIGSLSFLQVTRRAIKFRVSLKLGQIGPKIAELSAL